MLFAGLVGFFCVSSWYKSWREEVIPPLPEVDHTPPLTAIITPRVRKRESNFFTGVQVKVVVRKSGNTLELCRRRLEATLKYCI